MTPPVVARRSRIRIALIDDHPIFREALRRLLETHADFEIVAEAGDGPQVRRVVEESQPDVLLLDLSMPSVNGIDALLDLPPGATRVIMLTAAIDPEDVLRAVQLGARGVILKESTMRDLIEGIYRVMEGKYVLGSNVVTDFAEALARLTDVARRPFGLTPREMEIIASVADGESNRDIAQHLSISLQTVKNHLTSIFEKTAVSTRLQLALFAIDHGMARKGHVAARPNRPQ